MLRETLLRLLEELSADELRSFAFLLQGPAPRIPRGRLDDPSPVRLAELLLHYCPEAELRVAARVLRQIPRRDLLKKYNLPGEEQEIPGRGAPAAAGPPVQEQQLPVPVQEQQVATEARRVSEKDLMRLARNLGKNWKAIGIEYLGVEMSRLEQIEEENPSNALMRAFYMLKVWMNCEKERATSAQLYHILSQDGVPLDQDAIEFLRSS